MLNVCFWNYADGNYPFMNAALIKSLRKFDINYDFYNLSPLEVKGAKNIKINLNNKEKENYLFKFNLLKDVMLRMPHDYFIFLDADSYCVRHVDVTQVIQDSPVHSFLESNCNSNKCLRPDWWGCPLNKYISLMRQRGVISQNIYNVNAGFWGVHKKAILQFYNLAMEFWFYCANSGFKFTEEAPLAYATHMMCGDAEKHVQRKWTNIWASDWTGNFKNILPENREWQFEDYMTTEKYTVNPAIVHAMRSKDALVAEGKHYDVF
jgi:hypothetical protein